MPSSSSLSRLVLAALGALLISTAPGHATCDPSTDPDKSDIANARAAVAANCDSHAMSRGAADRAHCVEHHTVDAPCGGVGEPKGGPVHVA